MSTNLEIEAKALISKEVYEKLYAFYSSEKSFLQTNFYIDTKDFVLSKNKIGLRIRKINDKYELTCKQNSGEGRLEINQKISAKDLDLLRNCGVFPHGEVLENISNYLADDASKLSIFGELETTRTEFYFNNDLVCLDHSKYCDKQDYEIEVESNSLKHAQETLDLLSKQHTFKYEKNCSTKLKRLLDAISSI